MTSTHTITVKGMNAQHEVLVTDSATIEVGPAPAPPATVLTTPHSCGNSWTSNNLQEHLIILNNAIDRSGDDQQPGGGAYVWVEGSGFTSSSQVTSALSTLMPTYNFGFNAISGTSIFGSLQMPRPVTWSNATITDGKLTGVCIDSGYRTAGEEEDDFNGEIIRKSAIAVGNNGVAYFMPSHPVFQGTGAAMMNGNRQAGSLVGFSLTNNVPTSTSQLTTMAEVFQHIRDTNSLASSVDFALVITYGNGSYTSE